MGSGLPDPGRGASDQHHLEEAREHTETIEEELFQLEEQLADEPEMVAKLIQIEEEYEEHLAQLELVVSNFVAGDTHGGIEALEVAAAQEAILEEELAELAHEIEAGIETSFLSAESAHNNAIKLIIGMAIIAVVAASYLVGTGVVLLLILRRRARGVAWGRPIAFASAAVFLLFGLNLTVREFELGRAQEAVVLQPQVDVMSAPLDDETHAVFTVHEGTKVRIDRLSEEWAEVVLEDGRVGWVPVGALETI